MQIPAAALAEVLVDPQARAIAQVHDVVVALHVAGVPPAAFDALRTRYDLRHDRQLQRLGLLQKPQWSLGETADSRLRSAAALPSSLLQADDLQPVAVRERVAFRGGAASPSIVMCELPRSVAGPPASRSACSAAGIAELIGGGRVRWLVRAARDARAVRAPASKTCSHRDRASDKPMSTGAGGTTVRERDRGAARRVAGTQKPANSCSMRRSGTAAPRCSSPRIRNRSARRNEREPEDGPRIRCRADQPVEEVAQRTPKRLITASRGSSSSKPIVRTPAVQRACDSGASPSSAIDILRMRNCNAARAGHDDTNSRRAPAKHLPT